MSKKKISTTVASVLATASLAIPATAAQASVQWRVNGALVGTTSVGTTFWGNWEVQNSVIGNIKCHLVGDLPVRNEGDAARAAVEELDPANCYTSPNPCPGVFLTTEAPVELRERTTPPPKSEKLYEARRGPMGLPWQSEGTEKPEAGLSISGVKLTVVAPCFSLEVPFEGTLEPQVINGTKNGLKPSRLVFGGTSPRVLTTKDLPTEKEQNTLSVVGEAKFNGESVQLVTLE